MVERLVGVDAQLHDGDGGVGEGVQQHRPRAVVDSPAVLVGADPGRVHDVADLVGQLGQARSRVVDVEQLLREAVEVVDGAGAGHGGHGRRVDVPVGADDQDRPGAWDRGTECLPCSGVAVVLQGVHRVPVADERGGHDLGWSGRSGVHWLPFRSSPRAGGAVRARRHYPGGGRRGGRAVGVDQGVEHPLRADVGAVRRACSRLWARPGVPSRLVRGSDAPSPAWDRGVSDDVAGVAGVVHGQAGAPLGVAHDRRAELGIVGQPRVVGRSAISLSPPMCSWWIGPRSTLSAKACSSRCGSTSRPASSCADGMAPPMSGAGMGPAPRCSNGQRAPTVRSALITAGPRRRTSSSAVIPWTSRMRTPSGPTANVPRSV